MELQTFNYFDNSLVRTIKKDHIFYFCGKDVAIILQYSDTDKAIRCHVDEEDRIKLRKLKPAEIAGLQKNLKNTIYINESGLYSLIMSSKKDEAKQFKRWITSVVLPELRKNGKYKLQKNITQYNKININNETQLHYKVVDWLRKSDKYKNAIINASCGELQDSSEKRIDCYI